MNNQKTMQIIILLAILAAIIIYATRFAQPGPGYRKVEEKTTTKYEKNAPTSEGEIKTTHIKEVKPTKEGSKVTIKEKTPISNNEPFDKPNPFVTIKNTVRIFNNSTMQRCRI